MTRFQKLLILIFLWSGSVSAQQNPTDSFYSILQNTAGLRERFDLIRSRLESVNVGIVSNVDSSLAIELMRVAQQLKNDSMLAISYNWLGSYFSFTRGDNVTALEFYYKGIPLAEKANDKRRLSSLYFDMAVVYKDLKNYPAVLESTIKGGKNLPDTASPLYNFMLAQYQRNFCEYYLSTDKPDSALYYANLMTSTAKKVGSKNFDFSSLFLRAASFAALNDTITADKLFQEAGNLRPAIKLNTLLNIFYTRYIAFLLNMHRIEQAKELSLQFLELGNLYNSNNIRLKASGFLRQSYDSLQNTDSAYYYSKQEALVNAAIFSQDNMNKLQSITMREQLRGIEEEARQTAYNNRIRQYSFVAGLAILLLIAALLWRNSRNRSNANRILQQQNIEIQAQKSKVERMLTDLRSTQAQLIQSEKMASLGELTAGIAHEIQNPLNFVNNFSEVSSELVDEMHIELDKGDMEEAKFIANDIKQNLEKINHHGKRADAIVKGMLQHSRKSEEQKEPTDINSLCDEYLRLSYHGLRAKDKSFNAVLRTDFDESIGKINIVPQDMGRVIMNLLTNAFYAVNERKKQSDKNYEPTISVSTSQTPPSGGRGVRVTVSDNGNGIPPHIIDKIFQPFFTTRPTGQGTGLGLSLAYDIVKAHGGELKVETKEGEGTQFILLIPVTTSL